VTLKKGAANGSVTITDAVSGTFNYTPKAGFSGEDTFTVSVNDGTEVKDYVIKVAVRSNSPAPTTTTSPAKTTTTGRTPVTTAPSTPSPTQPAPGAPTGTTPDEPDMNEPVNGIYPALNNTVLERQIQVAENGVVTVPVHNGGILTSGMLKNLREKDLTLTVQLYDENDEMIVIWEFVSLDDTDMDIPLGAALVSRYQSQYDKIFKDSKYQTLALNYHGLLPGKVNLTFRNKGGLSAGDNLYVYYLNNATSQLELIEGKALISSDGQYLRLSVDYGAEYVVSTLKQVNSSQMPVNTDQPDAFPVWAIILCSAGGLILLQAIGLGVYWLIRRSRKTPA
jgi:hypothetical protein